MFCLRLSLPGDAGECEGQVLPTLDDGTGRVRVLATCAPRLVHVLGAGARPTLVLADGGRRVPARRDNAWHTVLRAREALRAVRVDGDTTPVSVPPAAEQCGYRAAVG